MMLKPFVRDLPLVLILLSGSPLGADDLGDWDISRTFPDGSGWCPSIEAPRAPGQALVFEADGPIATITFSALSGRALGGSASQWLMQRIDNVAVVEAGAFRTPANPRACGSGPGLLCCNVDDNGDSDSRFFDPRRVDPARIVFRDDFADGPDPRWRGVGDEASSPVYWIPDSSAPEPPVASPPGGSLGLGRTEDGSARVEASFTLTDLVAGRSYVVAGWWHVDDHADQKDLLKISVTSPYALENAGELLRFNDMLEGDQTFPDTASNEAGDSVVVWETPDKEGSCQKIHGRRARGDDLVGGELEVYLPANCDGGPNAVKPSVDFAPEGDLFAVSWTEDPGLALDPTRRVKARRLSFAMGTPLADAMVVKETLEGIGPTEIAFDRAEARFAVAWREDHTGTQVPPQPLIAKTFQNDGTPIQDEVTLVEVGQGSAAWSAGDLAVAWAFGAPVIGEPHRVFNRLFSGAGAPLGDATVVSEAIAPMEVHLAVAEPSGDFLVVWADADEENMGAFTTIFSRLYDTTGNPLSEVTRVSDTAGFHSHPDVASDGESYLVAWQDDALDPPKVLVRRLDAAGVPDGQAFLVEPEATGEQLHPAAGGGPAGDFLVVWEGTQDEVDDPSKNVLGRRLVVVDDLDPATAITDLADPSLNHFQYFRVGVPGGVAEMVVTSSGGTGDADLFLRAGAPPTPGTFDASSVSGGNAEKIRVALPAAGVWYLGVRATAPYSGLALEVELVPSGCIPNGTVMCLNRSRFQVEVEWLDFEGVTGDAKVVDFGSDDSGLFWFFSPNNWEMLVKVLDGCGINDRFWVFAAATTTVGYTLRVTDTVTGVVHPYSNPLGNPARTITDTSAFSTCSGVAARPRATDH